MKIQITILHNGKEIYKAWAWPTKQSAIEWFKAEYKGDKAFTYKLTRLQSSKKLTS